MRKPTPTTVIACAALFFSLTGAGLAASHFVITSVSQIKPSVRHALRGHAGPRGPAGPVSRDTLSVQRVNSNYAICAASTICTATASCPSGDVTGGGYTFNSPSAPGPESVPNGITVLSANASGHADWSVQVENATTDSVSFYATAVCSQLASSASS